MKEGSNGQNLSSWSLKHKEFENVYFMSVFTEDTYEC